jgi:hypothetical protein
MNSFQYESASAAEVLGPKLSSSECGEHPFHGQGHSRRVFYNFRYSHALCVLCQHLGRSGARLCVAKGCLASV